jgi:hypothetical protein
MPLSQLIYASRPFGFDAQTLDDILIGARHNNAKLGVTGALICRADLYVQLLEGPRAAITELFGKIIRDDRHLEVALVWCGDIAARSFPDWDMRDDPVASWMWSQQAVRDGAARAADAETYRAIFTRLAVEPRAG